MEIKILEIYEQKNQLRIKVETPYGIDNLGLGLKAKYLDPETDEPKWKKEVCDLLNNKYGNLENRQKKKLPEYDNIVNKSISLDELKPKIKNDK